MGGAYHISHLSSPGFVIDTHGGFLGQNRGAVVYFASLSSGVVLCQGVLKNAPFRF